MTVEIILKNSYELEPITGLKQMKRRQVQAVTVAVFNDSLHITREHGIPLVLRPSHRNILYLYVKGESR